MWGDLADYVALMFGEIYKPIKKRSKISNVCLKNSEKKTPVTVCQIAQFAVLLVIPFTMQTPAREKMGGSFTSV